MATPSQLVLSLLITARDTASGVLQSVTQNSGRIRRAE
jgi:hypothetical protein